MATAGGEEDDGPSRRRKNSKDNPPDMSEDESRQQTVDNWDRVMGTIPKPSINLVLCGANEDEKTTLARVILGQPELSFVSEESSECIKHQEEVCGRRVSLVNLPALNGKSEEAAMLESLKCISLCDPRGVHAFFLVISMSPLTDDDKTESQVIQDIFGSQGSDITMPVFTTDLDPTHSAIVNFIKGNRGIRELCQSYRKRYVLNINNKQQIPALLDKADEMRTKSRSGSYTTTSFAHAQIEKILPQKELLVKQKEEIEEFKKTSVATCYDDEDCFRIVLIGRTGSGKSSSGNTILGRKKFKTGSKQETVTKCCQKEKSIVDGRPIIVVDTPGLFDTTLSNEEVHQELVKCISLLCPGPHAFLLVLQIGRFIEDEMKTLQLLQEVFGKNSEKFTIVLFTRGDTLQEDGQSFEEFIAECEPYCKKLISSCGGRCHVFNNYDDKNRKQVSDIITMIDTMVKSNGGSCYTTEMFQEAEESIKKEMEKILKEKEEEIQRLKEELERKHEEEMKDMERKLDEKTVEVEQERKVKSSELIYMEKSIERMRKEREQDRKERKEKKDKKRREQEHPQREEFQMKLADLETKMSTEMKEKQTIDRALEQSREDLRRQQEAWEKKQKEWWGQRAEDEEEAHEKEQENFKNLQEKYEKEREEYERKREEEDLIRRQELEALRKELAERHRRDLWRVQMKHNKEARKKAEELNDFKHKYTKIFSALIDQQMREMKLRHGRQLQETEGRHDKEYKLLGDLSQHKEKNFKEELEDLKRKHEQEMEELKDKYQSKCVIL